jgi:hypothetical protein
MLAAAALLVASFTTCPPPQDQSPEWLWFEDRTSAHPPTLVVRLEGGDERRIAATADAALLEYLPEFSGGALPQLALDTAGKNRVLLDFDFDEPLGGGRAIESAHLEFVVHQSTLPTKAPLGVRVEVATTPWTEGAVSWNSAPTTADEPLARGGVGPQEELHSLDVTVLARHWASGAPNHGLLLRADPDARKGLIASQAELDQQFLTLFDFAPDMATALARAKETKRDVLAIVVSDYGNTPVPEHFRILAATVLVYPDVRADVEELCVPVIVRVDPNSVAVAAEGQRFGEPPFAPLDLDLVAHAAPALVRIGPNGKVRGALASIGVFSHADVRELLRGSLGRILVRSRDGTKAHEALVKGDLARAEEYFAKLGDDPEARYHVAALRDARGDRAGAVAILEQLERDAPSGPWALAAAARRLMPDIVVHYQSLADWPPERGKGESALIATALEQLSALQLPDGSFPMGAVPFEPHRIGITVLAAHALFVHGHVDAALRARAFVEHVIADTRPEDFDTFAACYWLDFVLALAQEERASNDDVAAAIALVVAGQLESGAWSYNRRFGMDWRGGNGWPATELGRAHAMNTGQALDVLLRARERGFAVDELVLTRGRDALLAMREAPACFTYTHPEPRNFTSADANVARAPLCESALRRMNANTPEDLALALDHFENGLAHLRVPGLLTDAWLPPHGLSAYFRGYAWLHGLAAARLLGGEQGRDLERRLRAEVHDTVLADGTWIDTLTFGKAHGTAVALLVLAPKER